MIKRTVEISTGPAYLHVHDAQLVVEQNRVEVGRVPLEDLGVLIIDTKAVRYSHAVLVEAARCDAVVVLCADDHHPAALLTPIAAHSVQSERLRVQVEAGRPLHKRLWRQIVRAKILGQASLLAPDDPTRGRLAALADRVRSGDPENVEAQAARLFWPALLGTGFRRERDGPPPNPLLNYGYMALRAAMARAICAAGLHPSLGFHHRSRYNPFCLADDLLEPYRPFVDFHVRDLHRVGVRELDRPARARLLSCLTDTVHLPDGAGPLLVAMSKTAASLCRCLEGDEEALALPLHA